MRPYVFCALLLWSGLARPAGADEACGTCHPQVRTQYRTDIHAKDFGCTACHGGDPAALDAEHAHAASKGYVGKPARTAIPALCATCHADPNRMKPFGLPTDQYAQYQTSEHGRQLARGDSRVAVCTDCHGTHGIRAPEEPLSPVFRRNIPATCGRCHSDAALMAQYNLPADAVDKFRRSVHGVALLVEDHPRAPNCATCHGAHGATALQNGSISTVCGHCHARTREYFAAGPHGAAAAAGKMSECIGCHHHHDTAHPDDGLFDTACPQCHAAGSAALDTGQKLKTVLSRARESIDQSHAAIAALAPTFPTISRYSPRLQQARAYLLEALPVQHSLALDRVDDLTRNARSIADEVQAAVHGIGQETQLRYLLLGIAWLFILFAAGLIFRYRQTQRRSSATDASAGDDQPP